MFKTRLLSGILLVGLLLGFGILGGDLLLAGLGAISLVGMQELYRVFQLEKSALGLMGYGAVVVYYLGLKWMAPLAGREVFLFSMGFLILLMSAYVFSFPKYKADQVMAVFFGAFYVAVTLSCIYLEYFYIIFLR